MCPHPTQCALGQTPDNVYPWLFGEKIIQAGRHATAESISRLDIPMISCLLDPIRNIFQHVNLVGQEA